MAIFSKPVRLSASCYELGHCWTPHCLQATTDVAKDVFSEAIKIYGALYLLTALFRRKGWNYYKKKFLPETLQSTVFLAVNGSVFMGTFCVWRKLRGFYTFYDSFICGIPVCAACLLIERKSRRLFGDYFYFNFFLHAFIAAGTAILLERKNRRGPLAIYLTNLAVETGFRMMVNRGHVRPVENGEVLLFSLASAVYLYLFRKRDGLPAATLSFFKFLVGSDENPDRSTTKDANSNTTTTTRYAPEDGAPSAPSASRPQASSPTSSASSSSSESAATSSSTSLPKQSALSVLLKTPGAQKLVASLGPYWLKLVNRLKASPKHGTCPHPHGCLHYVLKGLCKMFGFGYVMQLLIKVVSSLSTLRRKPSEITRFLWGPGSFGLAAFLGLYSAVFRGVNCALRWWRQKDDAAHGMVAGFLAGGAMYFYKSVPVALFCASKLTELLYLKGMAAGKLPHIPCAEIIIYAVSCAFVFHAAVVEPHALRPAYWKWLLRVTHNKFAYMNRHLLDEFGLDSAKMFRDYWPNYDPRYTNLVRPPPRTS